MVSAMKYVHPTFLHPDRSHCFRKNLADLNYPAPQTVSKVDDKVIIYLTAHPNSYSSFCTGLCVLNYIRPGVST